MAGTSTGTSTSRSTSRSTSTAGGRLARWHLIGLEVIVGVAAVYGGVGLMVDGLGMPDGWLVGTPFGSWLLPGVFLLLVVAAPMLLAASGELAGRSWAFAASLAAGALQAGWIVAQLLIIQRYFVLQPIMFGAGVFVAALAWWVHRGEPVLPPVAGRRPEARP